MHQRNGRSLFTGVFEGTIQLGCALAALPWTTAIPVISQWELNAAADGIRYFPSASQLSKNVRHVKLVHIMHIKTVNFFLFILV